jgi:hypothetical protein
LSAVEIQFTSLSSHQLAAQKPWRSACVSASATLIHLYPHLCRHVLHYLSGLWRDCCTQMCMLHSRCFRADHIKAQQVSCLRARVNERRAAILAQVSRVDLVRYDPCVCEPEGAEGPGERTPHSDTTSKLNGSDTTTATNEELRLASIYTLRLE